MPLTIHFNFENSDWMAFHKQFLNNSAQFQRTKRILTYLFPAIWTAILVMNIISGRITPIAFGIFAILVALWIVFYPKRLMSRALRKAEKVITQADNAGVLGPQIMVFDDEGIVHTQADAEQKLTWNGVKKLEETEDYYFLYNTTVSALIIPKKKIPNEVKDLGELLKKYVGNRI